MINTKFVKSGDCNNTVPHISNLFIYDKNKFYKSNTDNFQSEDVEIFQSNEIILIGIELPRTIGKYRDVEKIILEKILF